MDNHSGIECEEILLDSSTITNGTDAANDATIEYYLEESDPMGDMNECDQSMVVETLEDEEEEHEVADAVAEEVENVEGVELKHKPAQQVPKKRKDAAILAGEGVNEEPIVVKLKVGESKIKDENNKTSQEALTAAVSIDDEKPTSSARAYKKRGSVNEEQCRVCTGKNDLVSLFKKVEELELAEMLMSICPTISIARKDFMPQYICNACVQDVTNAVQLKMRCETTERELRKQLSRHQNNVRRPKGYVVIDAPLESDPPTEEEPDDVEFVVSEEEANISADDDSDDYAGSKKKRATRAATGKRKSRKLDAVTSTPKQKRNTSTTSTNATPTKKRAVTVLSSDEDDIPIAQRSLLKKKRKSKECTEKNESPGNTSEYGCDECSQVFTRKLSLVLHKKSHSGGREPINCEICGKQFKIKGAYRTHMERHNDDNKGYQCNQCDAVFAIKMELRHHLAEEHDVEGIVYQCEKCRRTFVSQSRLNKHTDGRCPGFEGKFKKNELDVFNFGKNLFKSVAPPTTTYWSDSFSD